MKVNSNFNATLVMQDLLKNKDLVDTPQQFMVEENHTNATDVIPALQKSTI